LRAFRREIKMLKEGKVKRKICVWKRNKEKWKVKKKIYVYESDGKKERKREEGGKKYMRGMNQVKEK
jgi:hypothetical protein